MIHLQRGNTCCFFGKSHPEGGQTTVEIVTLPQNETMPVGIEELVFYISVMELSGSGEGLLWRIAIPWINDAKPPSFAVSLCKP